MKYEEFLPEINKLTARFGEKYYPEEVVLVLYDQVKKLDAKWFRVTVAQWLGQHKPALIPEFKEAAGIEKNRLGMRPGIPQLNWTQTSIFSPGQQKFLFALTQRIASRTLKDQDAFVAVFCVALQDLINRKDQRTIHKMFLEVSEQYGIPYEDEKKSPPPEAVIDGMPV